MGWGEEGGRDWGEQAAASLQPPLLLSGSIRNEPSSKIFFLFPSAHCVGGGVQALLANLLNLPLELEAASVRPDPNPRLFSGTL